MIGLLSHLHVDCLPFQKSLKVCFHRTSSYHNILNILYFPRAPFCNLNNFLTKESPPRVTTKTLLGPSPNCLLKCSPPNGAIGAHWALKRHKIDYCGNFGWEILVLMILRHYYNCNWRCQWWWQWRCPWRRQWWCHRWRMHLTERSLRRWVVSVIWLNLFFNKDFVSLIIIEVIARIIKSSQSSSWWECSRGSGECDMIWPFSHVTNHHHYNLHHDQCCHYYHLQHHRGSAWVLDRECDMI